ncbi:MAG: Flavin-dependent thymidylate synthase [Anaerolineales bacterium]|nr:Flavin-dependent thymidylate synthase [Anaerolineales bacterium]
MARVVEPKVYLVGETRIVAEGLNEYLSDLGVSDWETDAPTDAEKMCEVMGRLCYRSFSPDLNPNVSKVRQGNATYLSNIVKSRHGSVLEHAFFNFIISGCSRVFTHELVRHRVGVAISQESLRFVRLDQIDFPVPTLIRENEEAMTIFVRTIEELERMQVELAGVLDVEDKAFHEKKKITSAMRRIAPQGLGTSIGWSANARTIRHILEMRTDPAAEEEIRRVFGLIGQIMTERYPNLFGDYEVEIVEGLPAFRTEYRKV